MILYFDASALVKRYFDEAGSGSVRRWAAAGRGATARLSLVEMASAVARRVREGTCDRTAAAGILRSMSADADGLLLVELQSEVEVAARALVGAHPIRAADAIQLASCLFLRENRDEAIAFVGYDSRLNAAARSEGLRVRGARPTR